MFYVRPKRYVLKGCLKAKLAFKRFWAVKFGLFLKFGLDKGSAVWYNILAIKQNNFAVLTLGRSLTGQ